MPWKSKIHQPIVVREEHRAKAKLVVSRSKRGYTSKWDEASRGYLKKHPLCVECLEDGRRTPSMVTDHVVPHKGDMRLFWDTSNWQALCKTHHDRKTQRENR